MRRLLGGAVTDDELIELAMLPDPELEAELDAMEAADPHLKVLGDRIRDLEAYLTGIHSAFGVHLASLRRMEAARAQWRSKQETP